MQLKPNPEAAHPRYLLMRAIFLARVRSRGSFLPWVLFALLAAALGWSLGAEGVRTLDETAVRLTGTSWISRTHVGITLLLSTFAALNSIDQICSDASEGWLLPLFALGVRRHSCALATATVLIVEHLIAYFAVIALFGIAVVVGGGSARVPLVQWMIGGGGYVMAATGYGLLVGVLVRRRVPALLLAIGLALLPVAISLAWTIQKGIQPSLIAKRLLFLHAPPPTFAASSVGFHLLYVVVAIGFVMAAAGNFLGRRP